MNKAEKKALEVKAIANCYGTMEYHLESIKRDIEYWENSKANVLADDPEAGTSYYDEGIAEKKIEAEVTVKVLETIYKLM